MEACVVYSPPFLSSPPSQAETKRRSAKQRSFGLPALHHPLSAMVTTTHTPISKQNKTRQVSPWMPVSCVMTRQTASETRTSSTHTAAAILFFLPAATTSRMDPVAARVFHPHGAVRRFRTCHSTPLFGIRRTTGRPSETMYVR